MQTRARTFEERGPFERLALLLEGIEPGADPVDMTVGGPKHPMPPFVGEAIAEALSSFRPYPAIDGTAAFRDAVHAWLDRRYGLGGFLRERGAVLPLSGSREGLFFAGIAARDHLKKPDPAVVLFANPFYQAYPAAAHAIGAEAVPLRAAGPDTVLPDLSSAPPGALDRAVALYVASPANPQGTVAAIEDWQALVALARRHDLMLFADECYSEIYRERAGPPPGVLAAAKAMGGGLDRVVAFNSLSKRSNLAGLRCGFAAGDPAFMDRFRRFRNQAGPQVPAPIQAVAVRALADEAHVAENRRLYDAKFAAADEILSDVFGPVVPEGGFFLWLDLSPVGGSDDVAFARELWAATGVRAVPGSYLALTGPDHNNPGDGFLRLALVDDLATVRRALVRLRDFSAARIGAGPAD